MTMLRPAERADLMTGAKLFRGLGDPMRLAILELLAGGEQRVTDLVSALGSSQANVSGHLSCLKDCGLVADLPQGRAVLYRLACPELVQLLRSAERVLDATGHKIALCTKYGAGR